MNKNMKACTHMKSLEKKAVKTVEQNPPKRQCGSCKQDNYDQNIICLHCHTVYDNQCLIKHQQQQSSHIFSININFFLLSCKLCNDDIQTMMQNYEGSQNDEEYQRMIRFTQFIREAWIKVAISYGIFTKQTNSTFIRGLVNLGNTCFLNATLQVLSLTNPLVKLYQEVKFEQKIHRKLLPKAVEMFYDEIIEKHQNQTWHIVSNKKQRKLKEDKKIFGSISTVHNNKFNAIFSNFIHNKLNENFDPLQPSQILSKLCDFDKKYTLQQEQDAQELLILMLDSLSQGEMLSVDIDKERYKNVQKILGAQKLSMIQNIFGSYLASQIICQKCKKQSWTLDITYHFSVPIRKSKSIFQSNQASQLPIKGIKFHKELYYPSGNSQPQPFLSPFFESQQLSKFQNYYSCQSCKGNFAVKKFFIIDPPQILVISLKRFEKQYKIKDPVDFPQTLDISMLCLSEKQEKVSQYKLYGLVVHEGQSVNSGHYISYVRSQSDWFRCSDESIKKVTWKQVKRKEAYILFYERQIK